MGNQWVGNPKENNLCVLVQAKLVLVQYEFCPKARHLFSAIICE